jgi:hypothetical protein
MLWPSLGVKRSAVRIRPARQIKGPGRTPFSLPRTIAQTLLALLKVDQKLDCRPTDEWKEAGQARGIPLMGLSESVVKGERLEGGHNPQRLFRILSVLGAGVTLFSLALVLTRDIRDPLWRVHRALDRIEVPERWQLVHEAEDEGAHGFFGGYPQGERTYIAREEPRTACGTSLLVLAAWSHRTPQRIPGDVRFRCSFHIVSDDVFASVTVWDAGGWAVHAEVIELDLGRPIGEGTSVVELAVTDS